MFHDPRPRPSLPLEQAFHLVVLDEYTEWVGCVGVVLLLLLGRHVGRNKYGGWV